jgi:hypothetical protein
VIPVGDKAPEFSATTQDGATIRLADLSLAPQQAPVMRLRRTARNSLLAINTFVAKQMIWLEHIVR